MEVALASSHKFTYCAAVLYLRLTRAESVERFSCRDKEAARILWQSRAVWQLAKFIALRSAVRVRPLRPNELSQLRAQASSVTVFGKKPRKFKVQGSASLRSSTSARRGNGDIVAFAELA